MAKARSRPKSAGPRRLPRGRHALAPEEAVRDQRERLPAAVPGVVAKRGYEARSVAHLVKAAAVSRNAFYKNFKDKQDCFATAHEAGHERLFETLSLPCEDGATIEERAGRSLGAAPPTPPSQPPAPRPPLPSDPRPSPREGGAPPGARVGRSLGAAPDPLASDPEVARLLFVE